MLTLDRYTKIEISRDEVVPGDYVTASFGEAYLVITMDNYYHYFFYDKIAWGTGMFSRSSSSPRVCYRMVPIE